MRTHTQMYIYTECGDMHSKLQQQLSTNIELKKDLNFQASIYTDDKHK